MINQTELLDKALNYCNLDDALCVWLPRALIKRASEKDKSAIHAELYERRENSVNVETGMKISTNYFGVENTRSVNDFIHNAMRSDRDGISEDALATAENVARGLSRLCELLAAKGVITARDLTYIAHGYANDDVRLVEG